MIEEINKKSIEFYKKEKDLWRSNFHFEAPFGLINDPNGLSFYKGEYYIFFQWNPYGCEHKFKHWGVTKTKDFKNFTIPKIALTPDKYYDKNGCYSGGAIAKDGKLELMYTGNVKDEDGNRKSYQCIATLDKDIEKKGPFIEDVPNGYTQHFRDPFIWKKDDKYHVILGCQSEDLKGRALMYSSSDFENWNFDGKLKTKYEDFGFMWECPAIINIDNKDIFIFSPQGLEKEEFKYQNIYQAGYLIGNLNYETLEYTHNEFEELDFGFDFYAPQVFKDDKERNILIGWMGLPEEEKNHNSKEFGWVHSLTMPRELFIKDNKLYQKPLSEIDNLIEEKIVEIKNLNTTEYTNYDIKENSYKLTLDIDKINSKKLELEFFSSDKENMNIKFDFENSEVILDRNNMLRGLKGIRKLKLDIDKNLKIDMYVDKSSVEIYLQDGLKVLSSRVYPDIDSTNIKLKSSDNININNLEIYSLGSVNYNE